MPLSIHPARLAWRDGEPWSQDFGDRYFCRGDGPAESRHVFLDGNRLDERWRADDNGKPVFTIFETGFGAGLNFLETASLWRQSRAARSGQRLRYLSVEQYPLSSADLRRVLDASSREPATRQALLEQYPPALPGIFVLEFPGQKIELWLIQYSLDRALKQLDIPAGTIDCWYLDGFAPRLNPDMWTTALYQKMARWSAPGATAATYSCAGQVVRGLQHAGFRVDKTPGFGSKRNMLTASLAGPRRPYRPGEPWFARPRNLSGKSVAIIGGGLAGCATAARLSREGYSVTLFEAGSKLASGASAMAASAFYPFLSRDYSLASELYWQGYQRLANHLQQNPCRRPDGSHGNPCGALFFGADPEARTRLEAIAGTLADSGTESAWLDSAAASKRAGLRVADPALWLSTAGYLDTAAFCEELVAAANIRIVTGTRITSLRHTASGWTLAADGHCFDDFDAVVLCTGAATELADNHLGSSLFASLVPLRGQLTRLPALAELHPLNCLLCGDHYLTPTCGGVHYLGATFDPSGDAALSRASEIENLDALTTMVPAVTPWASARKRALAHRDPPEGQTGFRLTTPDRLPLIGPVAGASLFEQTFADLLDKGGSADCPEAPYEPGVFINCGHGSRGLTASLAAADLVTALIAGGPLPISRRLAKALHPMRFLVREMQAGAS